jgi:hypothetical protein
MTNQFPDATKMVLSTAAQAVLDAYRDAPLEDKLTVAVVLRAVVHWLAYETQLDDPMMTTTHVVDADRLDAIANELENQ